MTAWTMDIARRFRIAHTGRPDAKRRQIRYLARQIADFPDTEIVSGMLHLTRCTPCHSIRNSAKARAAAESRRAARL